MISEIQLMYVQTLFTELEIIDQLLSYDRPIHTFSRERQEISAKNQGFSRFEILLFWCLITVWIPFLAKMFDFIVYPIGALMLAFGLYKRKEEKITEPIDAEIN